MLGFRVFQFTIDWLRLVSPFLSLAVVSAGPNVDVIRTNYVIILGLFKTNKKYIHQFI